MPNELQTTTPSALNIASDTPVSSVQQTGEKNVYAAHVDNLNVTVQAGNVAPQLLTQTIKPAVATIDRTHYNFFVTYEADFSQNTPFTIETDRALTEYMSDDMKREFATLSPEIIERIKLFPCIFANENKNYGHTDEDQVLGYGFIKQIKIRRKGIKIYPQIQYLLPQQRLNEALFELDLLGCSSFNEFNRMHWSIKKIDLIAELQELGFPI